MTNDDRTIHPGFGFIIFCATVLYALLEIGSGLHEVALAIGKLAK